LKIRIKIMSKKSDMPAQQHETHLRPAAGIVPGQLQKSFHFFLALCQPIRFDGYKKLFDRK
jgi:hypothetical protein